ncbi:MAG TPA: hypothetical protein VJH03_08950 [Blastocatellia bacterium]|nr:hypothetical protein [Blastocatellia bacterium]
MVEDRIRSKTGTTEVGHCTELRKAAVEIRPEGNRVEIGITFKPGGPEVHVATEGGRGEAPPRAKRCVFELRIRVWAYLHRVKDPVRVERGRVKVYKLLEFSRAEVRDSVELGRAEVRSRAERGTAEVRSRAERGTAEVRLRTERSMAEVCSRNECEAPEINAIRKPNAAKIEIFIINLFPKGVLESGALFLAGIVKNTIPLALVLGIKRFPSAGGTHPPFTAADKVSLTLDLIANFGFGEDFRSRLGRGVGARVGREFDSSLCSAFDTRLVGDRRPPLAGLFLWR